VYAKAERHQRLSSEAAPSDEPAGAARDSAEDYVGAPSQGADESTEDQYPDARGAPPTARLRSSAGWRRWRAVRARAGLRRYALLISSG
jgi:hypothetical protein